ncbi:FAD-binding oxidoreductase [Dyella japonica]|uniref:FAD-linked oxidase n=1 Tax=Dyella japonica A8 TaxID=1217721 RepID=A0A075KAX0_9GAMM|nr:FAD-binding oxidoreductase [Dyella japonica]AIF49373.1 FAD-linked oxidase [Dyella japonica A8]
MKTQAPSWGLYPKATQHLIGLHDRHAPIPRFDGHLLPRGNGRSYGDSCLNDGGALLLARGLDRYLQFDAATGVIECESGVLLSEILSLAVPQGWFLPVTPGTKFVTVGGAIANDVHGKNHHRSGTFGHHIHGFELRRTDETLRWCSRTENTDWFAATIGGLGLTGLITRVKLQLRRIASPWLNSEVVRFGGLPEFFALSADSEANHEYTVAWIDCAARGKALGRGLFSRANHGPAQPERRPPADIQRKNVPFTPPVSLINNLSLRAFNFAYYHKQRQQLARAVAHYDPFFYPLDAIGNWNRIYGPRGFLQYQCVVPPEDAEQSIHRLMELISKSGSGSFLAVLKQFGQQQSLGMMSFPRTGTTLALDFPNHGSSTLQLLQQLDNVVAESGGRVYPAKDARMSADHFQRYYTNWEAFSGFIDPKFSSSLWRRVTDHAC